MIKDTEIDKYDDRKKDGIEEPQTLSVTQSVETTTKKNVEFLDFPGNIDDDDPSFRGLK